MAKATDSKTDAVKSSLNSIATAQVEGDQQLSPPVHCTSRSGFLTTATSKTDLCLLDLVFLESVESKKKKKKLPPGLYYNHSCFWYVTRATLKTYDILKKYRCEHKKKIGHHLHLTETETCKISTLELATNSHLPMPTTAAAREGGGRGTNVRG